MYTQVPSISYTKKWEKMQKNANNSLLADYKTFFHTAEGKITVSGKKNQNKRGANFLFCTFAAAIHAVCFRVNMMNNESVLSR